MIQHAFRKLSRVNLISKDRKLVFYLSVSNWLAIQTGDYDIIIYFCVNSMTLATLLKKCNVMMT